MELLANIVTNFLFPKQCFGCGSLGEFICFDCQQLLTSFKHLRCIVCQKPSLSGWTHPKCKSSFTPERLLSVYDYHNPIISQMINAGKFAMAPEIFIDLARLASNQILDNSSVLADFVLCPIPMTKLKQNYRGFNQSAVICSVLSKTWQIAIDSLLIKKKVTKQQKSLDKIARSKNQKGVYGISSKNSLPNKVLLIDDVTTSGATFLSASKVIKQHGISTIWCLSLAQD